MATRFIRSVLLLTVLTFTTTASASTISLVPRDGTEVATGDTITLDVSYDFTDNNLFFGGAFDIVFDSSALSFAGIDTVLAGDPSFYDGPDVQDGLP